MNYATSSIPVVLLRLLYPNTIISSSSACRCHLRDRFLPYRCTVKPIIFFLQHSFVYAFYSPSETKNIKFTEMKKLKFRNNVLIAISYEKTIKNWKRYHNWINYSVWTRFVLKSVLPVKRIDFSRERGSRGIVHQSSGPRLVDGGKDNSWVSGIPHFLAGSFQLVCDYTGVIRNLGRRGGFTWWDSNSRERSWILPFPAAMNFESCPRIQINEWYLSQQIIPVDKIGIYIYRCLYLIYKKNRLGLPASGNCIWKQ